MTDTDIVQVITEARIDARSLSEFIFKPASEMVQRRLAPPINTLQFYLDKFNNAANDFAIKANKAIKDAQIKAGYVIVGNFTNGATLSDYNDAISDNNGNLYRWGGDLPKIVSANTTPIGTGGFGQNKWIEISSSLIRDDIAKLKSGVTQYHYTMMGKAFDTEGGVDDVSNSWPYGACGYDVSTDEFVFCYSSNQGHSNETSSVLMRKKPAQSDSFSDAIVVASSKGSIAYKTHAFTILPDGTYLAIITQIPWGGVHASKAWVYKSNNKGESFTRNELLIDGLSLATARGDVTGLLRTDSGRLLSFALLLPDEALRIIYSDDDGNTWGKAVINGAPYRHTEPAWCDLGGGRLICYARESVSLERDIKIPAIFMYSSDNGSTWSEPTNSKSITDFTNSNGELIVIPENNTVEFIHHSRFTEKDGYSSILRSWATIEDAWLDNFKPQVRVGKLAAYIGDGRDKGDSGYLSAKLSKDGVINAFYYTGQYKKAYINYMVGLPNTSKTSNRIIDHNTGITISRTKTGMDLYKYTLFNGGLPNAYKPNPPVVNTINDWVSGGGINIFVLAAHAVMVRNVSFSNSVNFDNISKITFNIKKMGDADYPADLNGLPSHDLHFAVVPSKTSALTAREAYVIAVKKGEYTIDTSTIRGDKYLLASLTARAARDTSVLIDDIVLHYEDPVVSRENESDNAYILNGFGGLADSGYSIQSFGAEVNGNVLVAGNLTYTVKSTTSNAGAVRLVFNDPIPKDCSYLVIHFDLINFEDSNIVMSSGISTKLVASAFGDGTIMQEVRQTSKTEGGYNPRRKISKDAVVCMDLRDVDLTIDTYLFFEISRIVKSTTVNIKKILTY